MESPDPSNHLPCVADVTPTFLCNQSTVLIKKLLSLYVLPIALHISDGKKVTY